MSSISGGNIRAVGTVLRRGSNGLMRLAAMAGGMPDAHKEFLLGFKRGEPDW